MNATTRNVKRRATVCWDADGMHHRYVAWEIDGRTLEQSIAQIVKTHGAVNYWLEHKETSI